MNNEKYFRWIIIVNEHLLRLSRSKITLFPSVHRATDRTQQNNQSGGALSPSLDQRMVMPAWVSSVIAFSSSAGFRFTAAVAGSGTVTANPAAAASRAVAFTQ